MRVRMKVSVSGTRGGQLWPGIGDEMDVPDGEGADLCSAGLAEPVAERKAEKAVDERPVEKRDDDNAEDDEKQSSGAVTTESGPARRRGRQ